MKIKENKNEKEGNNYGILATWFRTSKTVWNLWICVTQDTADEIIIAAKVETRGC